MSEITIFRARKIITMNSRVPVATHVAVQDGRILGAGTLEEVAGWGDHTIDERFADKVLMPGMIEGHAHLMEGNVWKDHYVGFYDRTGPDGRLWPGLKSIDEVVAYLKGVEAKMDSPDEPISAWGFDPIFFGGRRMTKDDLDKVSTTRPIIIVHASFHISNVNSAVLKLSNITSATNVQGIAKGPDGEPNGELQGLPAQFMARKATGRDHFAEMGDSGSIWRFAKSAQFAGVTTSTDLANPMTPDLVAALARETARDDYPVRLVPAFISNMYSTEEGIELLKSHMDSGNDKFRVGLVKMVSDGSIQGFTGRLMRPGYYNGAPNGLWYVDPDVIEPRLEAYHKAGFQVHIHTNGDQATDTVIDALCNILRRNPDPDARFTLQHCQLAHDAHFRRMANFGICANLFSNHMYYWGDQHYEQTVGPERAARMNATGTASRMGVPFAIHSDAPITPLAPLFTAWCAVNRKTHTGRILGPSECLTVEQALRAITLGAAYTLKLDDEIGSIEAGKRADFAVLNDDPIEAGADGLKDVGVWGTVVGGHVFANGEGG